MSNAHSAEIDGLVSGGVVVSQAHWKQKIFDAEEALLAGLRHHFDGRIENPRPMYFEWRRDGNRQ
jgi:hypothetical protein